MGKRKRRRIVAVWGTWIRSIGLVTVLGILWVLYVQIVLATPDNADADDTADVAVVLGAALWEGRPSPALVERLERAIDLYRNGQTAHIIVSGGYDYEGAPYTEAEGMRLYLLERGVAEEAIVLEQEATNTYENVSFSLALMEQRGWTSAFIVTHSYHGPRALDMAQYAGYEQAALAVTPSRVMNMTYHRARETLAYTKWQVDKLGMELDRVLQ
ncbi:YdcF family protein [Xylanibacillus composti]|uniref:YdcF family protein n=1 Tax=Xylanibacillus composti TaxID=1572762 RepID=UPI001BD1B67E|nr:YdcF family protein [Xylanibacillus composti]